MSCFSFRFISTHISAERGCKLGPSYEVMYESIIVNKYDSLHSTPKYTKETPPPRSMARHDLIKWRGSLARHLRWIILHLLSFLSQLSQQNNFSQVLTSELEEERERTRQLNSQMQEEGSKQVFVEHESTFCGTRRRPRISRYLWILFAAARTCGGSSPTARTKWRNQREKLVHWSPGGHQANSRIWLQEASSWLWCSWKENKGPCSEFVVSSCPFVRCSVIRWRIWNLWFLRIILELNLVNFVSLNTIANWWRRLFCRN